MLRDSNDSDFSGLLASNQKLNPLTGPLHGRELDQPAALWAARSQFSGLSGLVQRIDGSSPTKPLAIDDEEEEAEEVVKQVKPSPGRPRNFMGSDSDDDSD